MKHPYSNHDLRVIAEPATQSPVTRMVAELIATDTTGLMAGFVAQAIREFAKEVAKADPDRLTQETNGFVNGYAWVACAEQILAERDEDESEQDEDEPEAAI